MSLTEISSIRSRSHIYTIEETETLEDALKNLQTLSNVLFLVDKNVYHLFPKIRNQIQGGKVITITATEEQKNLANLTPIILECIESDITKSGNIVVIGGGVLQDIGCFIASILFRGISWYMIPTTLLAQADSCLGSKSSINIGKYKNQLGTFNPPRKIIITPEFLNTLPWDEIRSGMGEIIKLQMIKGEIQFHELVSELPSIKPNCLISATTIQKWVNRSIEVKKPYVENDEFDQGIRNILNYGHTFGHAYESASNYTIPHGISVLLGILTATYLSVREGLVTDAHYNDVKANLRQWYDPFGKKLKQFKSDQIINAIRKDKKAEGGMINCILTRGFGKMEKYRLDIDKTITSGVTSFIKTEM